MTEKIVSKGFYTHQGIPNFVNVKQYVIMKKGRANQIFFRFENPKNETLTAISFSVDFYDVEGSIIKSTKIEHSSLKVKGRSCFVINRPAVLPSGCADFQVTIYSVAYGNYRYLTHGNEVELRYEKQNNAKKIDRVPFLHKLGGHTHQYIFRTLRAPRFFLALFSCIIATLFLVLGIKLYTFTTTEEYFTLDMIDYTFATEERKDGAIVIVGTKTQSTDLIIPEAIDGHDIVAIEANAFAESNLRTITCKGSIEIRDGAFSNTKYLESVHIESAKTLGVRAFYNCKKLTEITVEKDLETIEQSAFESCTSLKTVSLPDSLQTINNRAFSNCSSLTSLTIPDSTSYIGPEILYNCPFLSSLQTPFVGSALNNTTTLNYFFNLNSSSSPVKNLVVTKLDKVGSNMFENETSLQSVKFSTPITEIGANAFNGCSGLKEFDLPVTVTTIGARAFANCTSLTSATIPQAVTALSDNLFYACSKLTTITLPDTLTQIGNRCFMNCSSLTSLNVPISVTDIGDNVLYGCTGLKTLTLPFLGNNIAATPKTLSEILGNAESCELTEFTLLSGNILPSYTFADFAQLSKVILPQMLTNISAYCFNNCTALSEISIPQATTSIDEYAFYNCSSLQAVDIPNLVATTGTRAFSRCSKLTTATFRNNATEIGEGLFEDCISLSYVSLPSSITSLANNMFKGCSSLEMVILPSGVTEISPYAFSGCTLLKSIVLPLSLTAIGEYAFANCESLPSFQFAASVQTIGNHAFAGCTALTSITLPSTVTYVGSYVFDDCTSIESMTVPFPSHYAYGVDLKYYFSDNTLPDSLKSVTISSVNNQYLPSYAFANCENIEELILPEDLTSIGSYAFKNCSSLSSLVIPDNVTDMEYGALVGTDSLEALTLPYAGLDPYQYTDGFKYLYCNYYSNYYNSYYEFVAPEALKTVTLTKATYIPSFAFADMSSIQCVNLPDTLTHIGASAFANCYSLNEIVLPSSLIEISSSAFSECIRLYDITNLSSLYVQDYFPSSLRIFTSETERAMHTVKMDSYSLLRAQDGVWYLTDYDNTKVNQELPSNVYYNLEAIQYAVPSYLFYNTDIQTLNISSAVTKIGSYALSGCSQLTSITSDNTTSFEEFGEYALFGSAVTSIKLPSSTNKISSYAFASTSLNKISIPASLTTMEPYAFDSCNSLTTITFENNCQLTELSSYVFSSSGIVNIALPASIVQINPYAFDACDSLKSVYFESNSRLSTVQEYAFCNSGINSITFPASLEHIKSSAFYGCSSLKSVTFAQNSLLHTIADSAFAYTGLAGISIPASVQTINSSAFYGCSNLAEVSFASRSQLSIISDYAFYDCGITSIAIPASVQAINSYAFYDCSNLQEVSFARGSLLSEIGSYAFYGTAISQLSLPSSMTSLGSYAFSACENLASVTLRSDFSCSSDAFYLSNNILEVYNLANLSLEIGAYNYGYVAQNAMIIHTDENAEPLHDVEVIGFNFKKSGDNWFITGLSQNNNSTELDFASFTYNGSLVNSYIIYKNAFSNKDITSVNIGPTVSEIMGHAFSDCSNLSTLTFEEDCTLTDISNYAFADCTKLRSVILPNSLRNLGEGTFRNCGQLESVLLPANLDNIGAAAFYNCTHLYDVMNLTSHNISVGSGSYGYAGYYALAVRVSNTPLELTTVTTTSTTANFVQYNDIWYLVRLDTLSDSGVIEIPRLIVNEQECRYTIFAYALSSLSNYYNRNVLIYNCVDAIGDNAASRLSYHTLYFYGSDKELETLNTSYTLNFYTYLECFHEENMGAWRYDDEGEISTTPTIEVSIISEPTCKETGSQKVSCSICGEEKIETLPTTNDHDFVDDTCTICNKTKQVCTISAENFDSCGLFSHSGSTRFTINDEGVITSQNHSDRSSSQLIITATDEMTITFDYMVSSESGYDHLKIYVNGTQHTAISGTSNNYQSLSIELNAGDTLTFEYSKDGSSSRGDDCAYIKNLTITTIVLVEETA